MSECVAWTQVQALMLVAEGVEVEIGTCDHQQVTNRVTFSTQKL